MVEAFLRAYRALVIHRPAMALGLVVLITVGMAIGLPNFKLDASADALTLEADRDLDFARKISQRYQSGDLLVVTYSPKGDLFSEPALKKLASLRDALKTIEGVSNAASILDVPLLYSPQQSLGQIRQGIRTIENSDVDLLAAKKEFFESPIYQDLLLGPDGKTTAIALSLAVDNHAIELVRARDALRYKRQQEGALSEDESQQLERISAEYLEYRTKADARAHERVNKVREVISAYKGEAEIFVGGVTMITADMISYIRSDLAIFGTAIVLFIIALLAVIFRQVRFVVLPLSISVLSVTIMLGLLSWLDWRLTVISTNFVALLLIVTLAITIHLVVRYREYHAENPDWSKEELVMATASFMFKPCLYTSLTTIVAFMSLVVSGIRPVIDFGWMMTIGLCVSFALVFVVLPAGLMLLPKGDSKDKGDRSGAFTLIFSRFTERFGGLVLVLSLVAAVVSALGISKLQVDNRFIDYFRSETEIHQGMKVIDQNLGGTIPLDIILDAEKTTSQLAANDAFVSDEEDPFAEADPFDSPDPFEAPEPLAEEDPFAEDDPFSEHYEEGKPRDTYWFTSAGLSQLESLHDYLRSLPEVGRVDSLATAYKVARDINGGSINDFELAVMRQSLPEDINRFLINPYWSPEFNQARVVLRVRETSDELKRLELIQKIRAHMTNELKFSDEQVHFTGGLLLYNNMLESLFRSQILTLGAVFIAIMIMFMLLFRSVLLAIIGIIPNILAACVVLGVMGLIGISLDMMTITIAAITVGIGVDDTIHYIHRFRREYAQSGDYLAAMHKSHDSIGRAMYYTSVIITLGFSVLALSKFIPSIYFGLLTGLAMLAAILGALTLLPRLIILLKPFPQPTLENSSGQADVQQNKVLDSVTR
ncbi:efflux RND transporter permease subunit [Marinibactrum halimedae]|uniref:Membrane protein n=1 Tax=Marinibactrum halimedae TaxID=1444977 RepID=A0AA37WP61_9GAMM|nr:efflux RND transporter permease subunit [Marinibactrum halimedae]MCD9458970.1 MMPL family transporter [Marinibactrum halimedae]GLS26901.1 membrane protein [Marinibactrum halimedae]